MVNYDSVNGVEYHRHRDDDPADEPATEQETARIDEFYFEQYSGHLVLTITTEDGYLSFNIPILPRNDWNEFVKALPIWGRVEDNE